MANNPHYRGTERDGFLDAVDAAIGGPGGLLRLYDGTQPANVGTALGAQVKLAELALSNPAFGASSGGVLTANAITTDASADATGTCTWGTLVTSGGTRIVDFSVGTSGADLNLNSVSITVGGSVAVSSFTITFAA